jgi:hypothetical protein
MFSLQGELILAVTYGHEKYERGDTEMLLAASKRRNEFAGSKINPGSLLLNHIPLRMLFYFLIFRIGNLTDLAHTL